MKYKTEEERKEANREAQRRFARTEKGKKYNLEKAKKWLEKKRETDPEYFKKFQKNRKEYFREYQIKLRKENPEKVRKLAREGQRRFARTEKGKKYNLERVKKWLKKKRETDPEYFKKWQKNKNRAEYFKTYQTKLRKENPEKAREAGRKGAKRFYQKTKRHPKYIILRALRRRLSDTIRKVGANKKASTMEILGCSAEDFKNYLENKFREGMIWENYGTWHIDHFYPCDSFDLTKDEEQKRCFHYTNLQPLWAKENIKKSNKIIEREVYV
jgi:hypothetical protein